MSKPIFKPFGSSNIRNIIFDLGGVIINLSYQKTIDEFVKLGYTNFHQLFTQAQQIDLFDGLEKGLIAPNEFRSQLRKLSAQSVSDQQIDFAWNAMLLDFPQHRLNLLSQVKQHYRIFLLSNTNAIHFEAYNLLLRENFGINNLSGYFQREYYSHLVKMRKPDAEVFEHILSENDLIANETLFIDDSIQHVEGAKKLGILAYHLNIPQGEAIEKLFEIV